MVSNSIISACTIKNLLQTDQLDITLILCPHWSICVIYITQPKKFQEHCSIHMSQEMAFNHIDSIYK